MRGLGKNQEGSPRLLLYSVNDGSVFYRTILSALPLQSACPKE